MKKNELANVVAIFTVFIRNLYDIANLDIPEDFDPEAESQRVSQKIMHDARVKYGKFLLENCREEEKAELQKAQARAEEEPIVAII